MSAEQLFTQHERYFEANRFVYPVLSRRSRGISIGINLNPDKVCNFDCVYCQVNRVSQSETRFVDTPRMLEELQQTLQLVTSGRLFSTDKFRPTPTAMRRLTDIAFSGDGEPTTHRNFDEVVKATAALRRAAAEQTPHLLDVPLVLITNASMFHRPHVQRALRILDENRGEIWAKLDAGTEAYFQQVNRAPFRFEAILRNITEAAQVQTTRHPITVHAHRWKGATAIGMACLLRSSARHCGRRGKAQADPDLHHCQNSFRDQRHGPQR